MVNTPSSTCYNASAEVTGLAPSSARRTLEVRKMKLNLLGQRFGLWTVIAEAANRGRRAYWLCRCDCGTEREVNTDNLRSGRSQACGCTLREKTRERSLTHGHCTSRTLTPEYRVWKGMKQRCTDPGSTSWKDYGGRGVKVCDRWLESFDNFYADMGPRPKGHSLERRDNDGPYSLENCRWATRDEQMNNTRGCIRVAFEGADYLSLSALAKAQSVSHTMLCRKVREGLTVEQAVQWCRDRA